MNASTTARARARAELTAEIVTTARRHLVEHGAAGLSLRAVSRDLGMASSAIYRYFPSRDALLTRLIIDAYDALADAAEARLAAEPAGDAWRRWVALASAVRDWAIANPAEYALIYGTPVPGYAAPTDTIDPAIRIILLFLDVAASVDDAPHAVAAVPPRIAVSPQVHEQFESVRVSTGHAISDDVLLRGIGVWCQVFGFVSFELFGTFNNTFEPADELFDVQLRVMAASLGIQVEQ